MNAPKNTLSPEDLDLIKANSFVRSVEFHRELPSTNDLALRRVACEEVETPYLLLTAFQTAGRGRGSNRWWAGPGALTFSLVISAEKYEPAGWDPRLSLVTALAVHDALRECLPLCEIKLKWPNDVFLGTRKVAGILLERPVARSKYLVVGMGININNTFSDAPEPIQTIATSLYDTTGQDYMLREVLLTLLKRLAIRYEELAANKLRLAEEWREHCMLRNRTLHVATGKQTLCGLCHGIDDQGALIVESDTTLLGLRSGTILRVDESETEAD